MATTDVPDFGSPEAAGKNELISLRRTFYGSPASLTADELQSMLPEAKAILAEHGWAFLINDSNDFLRSQFCEPAWSDQQCSGVVATLRERKRLVEGVGASYAKFIIPEKSVVYAEFLPRALNQGHLQPVRPAQMLGNHCGGFVFYLGPYMQDAKSYGQLYFRGDSHTNWLGAWLVYCFIITRLAERSQLELAEPVGMANLQPMIAAYDGDLFTQIDPAFRATYEAVWADMKPANSFEQTIHYQVHPAVKKAVPVAVPEEYKTWFNTRETFVYERPDGRGQRAVIFRDSTLDHCRDLLAEHFSRSVFIWHGGQLYQEVIDRERPDIVIHVMAERFVVAYPAFPPIATLPA